MNEILGHDRVVALLARAVREGRAAHAYLLTGPEGIGKSMVASRLAAMLNCPDNEANPACTCSVCRKVLAGTFPDCVVERPERGSIRIDRSRAIQNFLRFAPIEGRYRVVIVDDAHLMNRSAQNALLKILEEPPAARTLILVTSNPSLLLPTVRSRCRRIRCAPLSRDTVGRLLVERFHLEPADADVLAELSGGSLSRCLEMNTPRFPELREAVLTALVSPASLGYAGLLQLSAAISGDKMTALHAIEIALAWVRDQVVHEALTTDTTAASSDALDRSLDEQHDISYQELMAVFDEFMEARRLIDADINVNRNLVTDVMLLRVARIRGRRVYRETAA
jgi:DNA polymerase III subunit delta'